MSAGKNKKKQQNFKTLVFAWVGISWIVALLLIIRYGFPASQDSPIKNTVSRQEGDLINHVLLLHVDAAIVLALLQSVVILAYYFFVVKKR